MGGAAVMDRWRRLHEVSILIATGAGVGWCFGSQPRAKVSMMNIRPPQHGHGRGSALGSSIAGLDGSDSFGLDGMASSLRACAMFAARLPVASSP